VTNKKNKQFEVVVLLFSQILLVTVAEFSASYLVFLWDMGQLCKSRKVYSMREKSLKFLEFGHKNLCNWKVLDKPLTCELQSSKVTHVLMIFC